MKIFLILLATLTLASTSYASETIKGAKQDYQKFKKEMSLRLEKAEKKIEELRAKSQTHVDDTEKATLEELETTKNKIKVELENMKADSVKTSKKLKKELSASINSLNEKIQKALKD